MGRRNLNTKTFAARNPAMQNQDLVGLAPTGPDQGAGDDAEPCKQNAYENYNILQRIYSKIEEKQQSRADTAQGLATADGAAIRQSAQNATGTKRCPNLQQLIAQKKQESGFATMKASGLQQQMPRH